MRMYEERHLIVEYGKKLITSGLTKGTGGNISIFNKELGLMAISPSGMDYFETKPEDIVLTDLNGDIVEGKRKPSSEKDLHRIFYMKRQDVNAVVHAHSMYSTILATLGWELPAVNYYIAIGGGENIRCAEYKTFGTWELAESSFKAMENRYACFMGNHGLLACSGNIESAFTVAEETERMAEIYYKSKLIGTPKILDNSEIKIMLEKFKSYGQVTQK